MFLRQSLSSTADESVAAAQAAVQDQDPSAPRCCLSCPTGHLWEKRLSARVGTYPLPGVSQLGKFSAGLAGAGMCRCTREKHSSAWEQSKVNAFGATRVCPAPPLAQALALVLQHCRVRLLTRQTPFRGLQRSQGQHTPAQPFPRRLFRKRRQLVEEVFVAGDQSPWQPPRFPVFSCCTARLCSWVCVPGGGRRRQGGGGGLGCAGAGTLGSALLPLPRKHGNGGQAPWHPWEGQVGGRYAREGG